MSKTVILGSAGALGSQLSELFRGSQPKRWDQKQVDITDHPALETKLREFQPDIVINCAAYNSLDKAETEPDVAKKVNGEAVGNLAKVCKELDCLLVHFSTAYVFDGENKDGYNETDQPNPQSAYADSKYLGEQELQRHTDKFYLIRTTWLYGNTGPTGKKSFPQLMLEAASEQPSLKLVNDEYGNPTYIPDLAAAVYDLIKERPAYGIYHLTNSGSTNWLGWAEEIFKQKNINIPITPVSGSEFKRPAKRPHWGLLHNTKRPQLRPWQEALKDYLTTTL